MAKIEDIHLDGKTNWQGVAEESGRLLRKAAPEPLSADDWKNLVSSHSAKSDVVVRMHTKQTYGQMLERPLAEKKARAEHEKEQQRAKKRNEELPPFDDTWFNFEYFCEGWNLKDPDTGEDLPFTHEGMKRAAVDEIAMIADLVTKVGLGIDPNA